MKAKWIVVLLLTCGPALAQTVFTNGISVNGQAVRGVGLINLTNTLLPVSTMVPSVGQLAGMDPRTGATLTDAVYLLPLRAAWLETDGIYARSTNGLTIYDDADRALLRIRQGAFAGNGSALSNLNAAQVSAGKLPVSVLPTGGVWSAGGLIITNATFKGNGAGLTNLSAAAITTGRLASSALPTGGTWNAGGLLLTNAVVTGLTAAQIAGLGSAATTPASAFVKASGGTASNLSVVGHLTGNGAGLTNLSAAAITAGRLAASALPTGGTWQAGGLLLTNAVVTGLTAAQIAGLGSAATYPASAFVKAIGGTASNLTVTGKLTGNGAGLTNLSGAALVNLNASQITTGRLAVGIMPTGGLWNAGGLLLTNVVLAGAGGVVTPTLAQVLAAGHNGSGRIVSNVVVYGSGRGLTGLTASAVSGLGAAAFSNSLAFAAAGHGHNATQIVGRLAPAMLPSGGSWNAGGLIASNLTVAGYAPGTNYLPLAGGTVTNLTVASTATVAQLTVTNLTVKGVAWLPAQGDLAMGSFTNQP